MRSCQEVARLVSESMEHRLSIWERMGLMFHLSMCKLCRGFGKDLKCLRELAQRRAADIEADSDPGTDALSPEARERIQQALKGTQQ